MAAVTPRQVAAGQRRARASTRGSSRGKNGVELGERMLGELAIRRDLAAEDRQHRRAPRPLVSVSSLNT